jgi:hypothetical protein
MTEAPNSDKAPAVRAARRAIRIEWPYRALGLLLGLAGLGAGATAVFVTRVEAGPVALIAVGAIFTLVAMAGRIPRRLKLGENEADFYDEEIRETFSEIVDLVPPERFDEAEETLERVSPRLAPVVRPAQNALEYERAVLDLLAVLTDSDGDVHVTAPSGIADTGYDALIAGDSGRKVVVEIKYDIRNLSMNGVRRLQNQLAATRSQSGADQMLLITGHLPANPGVFAQFFLVHQIRVVLVGGRGDLPALRSAIREMLDLPKQPPRRSD